MVTEAMNRVLPTPVVDTQSFEFLCATQKCQRCGGMLVVDHCLDLLSGTGQVEFTALRCVQCGDIIDPVILQHRRRRMSVSSSLVLGEEGQGAPVVRRRTTGRREVTSTAAGI